MIIIYSGKGNWVCASFLLAIGAAAIVAKTTGLPGFKTFFVLLSVTGVLLRVYGRKLNGPTEADLLEAFAQGRSQVRYRKHSLYWIAMEHWGTVFAVLGLWFLYLSFVMSQ